MTLKSYSHYSKWPADQWPWKDFSPREMASKREGALALDTNAMDKLQRLRDRLGVPLIITSAYRSPEHNRAVGGAKNSYHMRGVAFDIRMDNHDPHEFEAAARAVGFTGFGYYVKNGFMHIDTGPARVWGKPWPESETRLPVEQPRVPEKRVEDKQAIAAGGAAASGVAASVIEHVPAFSGLLGNLAPVAQTVALVLAALFIGYVLWRRLK